MNCLLECALGLILFMAASLTYPQPERRTVTTETPTQQQLKSKMSIPDVEVLDQDGKKIRFYTDLVKGNIVAVHFIFTSCTNVCPPMGATFARVQKELATTSDRVANTRLISVSVDPVTDTPERLKIWRAKHKGQPGWTLVTGDKQKIDDLLRAFDMATARPEDHSPTITIGNDSLGQWTRTYALASPSQIIQIISQAANGKLQRSF